MSPTESEPTPAPAGEAVVDWQILTGEYPPQPGGVSDYTRLVAHALAAEGDRVTVWAPTCNGDDELHAGVVVRRLPDRFGRRSRALLAAEIDRGSPSARLLVQYVPHALGWKGANVPFCIWLARRRQPLWVMFHEVAYPFGATHTLAENALAIVTRRMAAIVARAADRIFVSIPAWRTVLERLARPAAAVSWLPVPSSVPVIPDALGVDRVRAGISATAPIVGHLGTYGRLIRPMLVACVPRLLESTDCHLLLLGRGSSTMRDALVSSHAEWARRIHAAGDLAPDDLSRHVAACDVMLQPYPDGVSSRRTSVMVALAHGRPVVTTLGALSEPVWADADAAVLVSSDEPAGLALATAALLQQPSRRAGFAARGRALYDGRFHLSHTVAALRARAAASPFTGDKTR